MLEFAHKALVCSEQSRAQDGKGGGAARVGDGEERREERAAGIAGEIKKKNNKTKRLLSSSGVKYFNFHPKLDCIPTAFLGWGLEHSVVSPRRGEGSSSRKQLQGPNINLCNGTFAAWISAIFLLWLLSVPTCLSPWQLCGMGQEPGGD